MKIADFGISKMLSMSNQQIMEVGGTPAFMSPELCENRPSFSGQLADVWAIGATIFMLRFGHPPFVAKSIINLYHKICHDPLVFPGPLDPGLKNLLEGMLDKDPEKRFPISQIIQHPWYRFPPPVTANVSQAKTTERRPSGDANAGNLSAKASSTSSNKTGTVDKNGGALSFQPPPNYDEEEAMAMKCPVQTIDNDDVYMSIGVGGTMAATKKDKDVFASVVDDFDLDEEDDEDEVDDDDDKPVAKPAANKFPKAKHIQEEKKEEVALVGNDNLMDTNWGADVFGIVEDDEDDDNDDEEVDDDDDEDNDDDFESDKNLTTGGKSSKSNGKNSKRSKSNDSADSKSKGSSGKSHHEMTEEEELRRSKQFIRKIQRKSTSNMQVPPSANSSASSISSPSKQKVANGTLNSIVPLPQQSSTSSLYDDVQTQPATPSQRIGKQRKPSVSGVAADDDDEPEELTSEEFQQMMDTLAQQPAKKSYSAPSTEPIQEEIDDSKNLHNLIVPLQNEKTNIGCAFYSEQGTRPTQEDRFVLLPSISNLKALESFDLHASTREQLSAYTLACVFDGHNGWRTSQHLSQFIPPTLVTHEKFLDSKDMKNAILDTFSMIDYQVS